jgi:hypothetical protein
MESGLCPADKAAHNSASQRRRGAPRAPLTAVRCIRGLICSLATMQPSTYGWWNSNGSYAHSAHVGAPRSASFCNGEHRGTKP